MKIYVNCSTDYEYTYVALDKLFHSVDQDQFWLSEGTQFNFTPFGEEFLITTPEFTDIVSERTHNKILLRSERNTNENPDIA